jgi:hypothetical protein
MPETGVISMDAELDPSVTSIIPGSLAVDPLMVVVTCEVVATDSIIVTFLNDFK